MAKIYFATSNKNKLREFEEILGFNLESVSLDLDEIQAVEVERVVEHKARQAFEKVNNIFLKGVSSRQAGRPKELTPLETSLFGSPPQSNEVYQIIRKPIIVEDTGLYIESLKGLPGALAKLFDKTIGYGELCKLVLENRKALAKTVIGYFDGVEYRNFVGEIEGLIAKEAKGDNNFGWDIIFIPKGFNTTFAQMSPEEKHKISMRKIALEKFKKFLLKR